MSIRTHDRTLRTLVPVASIIEGDRVRADYGNLQELADSIASEGLIHPPVIDLTYRLIAGGRRFRAMRDILKLTEIEVSFFETVDDATLRRLEAEENVKRKEMTWQEIVRSVKLVHQHQAISKASKGEAWTQSMTGKLLNRSQAHVSYALQIATLIDSNDDAITKCASLTDAIKLLIKRAEDTAMAQLARSTLGSSKPTSVDILTADSVDIFTASSSGPFVGLASRPDAVELPQDASLPAAITIPLSSMCICADAIAWMNSQPAASFDHIITDPPYGIDMDNIQQPGGGMVIDSTRAEHDITSNESLLQSFFVPAFRILRDRSFLVLWCDQSQWSLLDECATLAGFAVQRCLSCGSRPTRAKTWQLNTTSRRITKSPWSAVKAQPPSSHHNPPPSGREVSGRRRTNSVTHSPNPPTSGNGSSVLSPFAVNAFSIHSPEVAVPRLLPYQSVFNRPPSNSTPHTTTA